VVQLVNPVHPAQVTFKLSVFRWKPKEKVLHLKRSMPVGDCPFYVLVKGKYNSVKFQYDHSCHTKKHAYYQYAETKGPPNPHLDQNIQLIIPFRY
jgi:hypothetical protein